MRKTRSVSIRIGALCLASLLIFSLMGMFNSVTVSASPIVGTPSVVAVRQDNPPYAVTGTTYTNLGNADGQGSPFWDSRFDLGDFIAFCADYGLETPEINDLYMVTESRNTTLPALAFAIANEAYGARLPLREFNRLFDVDVSSEQRLFLMHTVIWAKEAGLDAENPAGWPAKVNGANFELKQELGNLNGVDLTADYLKIVAGMINMMRYAGATSLNFQYNPDTGTLSFSHI